MSQMQTGARQGKPNWFRRLTGQATAQSLRAFVVPEAELARRSGIDLEAAGLKIVANPRQANILLVIGEIPDGLADAAAVVYSQMLRPKAIMLLGSGALPSPLPPADIQLELDPTQFERGVRH